MSYNIKNIMVDLMMGDGKKWVDSTGHRNNFSGRAGQSGFLGTFGQRQADWESQAFARQHTPFEGTGSFGVTHMRPCDSKGDPRIKGNAPLHHTDDKHR